MRYQTKIGTAAILFLIGCVSGTVSINALSGMKRPTLKPVLNMGRHATRGIDCEHCHPDVRKGVRANTVGRDVCMDCHELLTEPHIARKLAPGGIIFDENKKPRWKIKNTLESSIKFSHKKHLKEGVECKQCHGDIENDNYNLATVASLYENCERCHRNWESSGKCSKCHSKVSPESRPHSHDTAWASRHGSYVRNIASIGEVDATCSACHSQDYCTSCHNTNAPRDHSSFFKRAGHGIDANNDRERCTTCHTEDRCVACHTSGATVLPADHAGRPVSGCDACHTNIDRHVVMATQCHMCHR